MKSKRKINLPFDSIGHVQQIVQPKQKEMEISFSIKKVFVFMRLMMHFDRMTEMSNISDAYS